MKKDTGKKFLQELKSQEASRVTTRFASFKGRFASRLASFVPARFLWIVPFLKEHSGVSAPTFDRFKKPQGEDVAVEDAPAAPPDSLPVSLKPGYPKYRCREGNPLHCELPLQTLQQDPTATACRECGFPTPLSPETKIRGNRGIYQIDRLLSSRGRGRLYQAVRLPDRQPVIIKEYLLPKPYFNREEIRMRQDTFTRLAGLDLADGRVQDFRLITPLEAIADSRRDGGYLVSPGNLDASPTLAGYLKQTGALTGRQVRDCLNQVLQSLEFLHGQKYRLPSGFVQQGLPHGNLSLDSLLVVPNFQGFFLYLCDLALWEDLFAPPQVQPPSHSLAEDLEQLGYVAFYALAGKAHDPESGKPLDPTVDKHWPPVDPALKAFIFNLMGIGTHPFLSAEAARQALLKLRLATVATEPTLEPPLTETTQTQSKSSRLYLWLLGILGLLVLGILVGWLWRRNNSNNAIATEPLPCCIEQVSGVPSGRFTYTAQQESTGDYIMQRENLIALGQTLEGELETRQPQLQLSYQPQPSVEEALAAVRSAEADFALTSAIDNLDAALNYEQIAYDGLVIFVPFSYASRANSLPQQLQGRMTFEQLRQLYTGQITNWREIGGPDLPVRLYIPTEDAAVRRFEQRVLQDENAIATFRQLIQQDTSPTPFFTDSSRPTIIPLQTFATLRTLIQGFETGEFGGISFGTLSQVFGQCSVYPLALVEGNTLPISPLIQANEEPITPRTDLCNDKGSYQPNTEALITQRYPLAYPLTVVYPRDNRRPPVGEKFAEMLKTTEAQRLLAEAGLIPLQPLGE